MQVNNLRIYSFLVSFIPITIVFSIFLADFLVTFTSIFFFIYLIKTKKFYVFDCVEFKIFIAFYCILILSGVFSNYDYSKITSFGYLRFGLFLLLIKYLKINYSNFYKHFSLGLSLSIVILFFGFLLQLLNFEFISINKPVFRYSSFFHDEAVLGSYLIKILPLTLGLLIFQKKKSIFSFNLFNKYSNDFFFSGERSALILLAIFIFISFFYLSFEKKTKFLLIFGILLITLTSIFLNEKLKHRVVTQTLFQLGISNHQESYIEIEIENKNKEKTIIALIKEDYFIPLKYYLMFNTSIKIFKDNVFFGSGIKTFRKKCKEDKYFVIQNYSLFKDKPHNYYKGFTGVDSCSTHPHNYYLQSLAETGIFSFIVIFFLFVYSLLSIIKSKNLCNKFFASGTFLNLFPLVFTGSVYNNYISILIFITLSFFT